MSHMYRLLLLLIMMPAIANAGFINIGNDSNFHNVLVDATEVGNTNYVKRIIENGYPVNSVNNAGQTALMRAAYSGNEEITKILINAKANLNLQDKNGNTALHLAASHDHIAVAQELIKHGASKNIKNAKGKTPLEEALKSRSVNVAKLIDPTSVVAVESKAMFPVVAAAGFSGKTILVGLGIAAGGGAAAAASGGGGGGSNSSPAPSTTPPSPPSPPTPTPSPSGPSSFENSEYFNSRSDYAILSSSAPSVNNGLGVIKASSAYARGATGGGVMVAVLDTGVDLNHPDLSTNIISSGYDFVNNDNHAQDDNGHGTHVAGIIAATRGNHVYFTTGQETNLNMHGVAYNAKILPVKVIDDSGSGSSVDIAAGIDYARVGGAKIVNLSLGGITISGVDPFPEITSSVTAAMQNNVLIFAASGNSGAANPIWPARNAAALNNIVTTGAIISVGSVDANNNVSSFSNRCGDAMVWCLVAPGENIHSTYWAGGSSYAVMNGTSMATPFASGAAAILLSEFPNLTPRQVAELLLETADDLGSPGVDNIYGHGLINLDRASNPVGQVIIPLSNNVGGAGAALASSSIVLSSAFGGALKNSSVDFTILDKYQRAYNLSLTNIIGSANSKNQLSGKMENFAEPRISKLQTTKLSDNLSLGFVNIDNNDESYEPGLEKNAISYLSMITEVGGVRQVVNYNIPIAEYFAFGAVKGLKNGAFMGDALYGNPYLALARDGISSISSFTLEDGGLYTNFATFQGGSQHSGNGTSGMVEEVAVEFSGISLASQFGFVNEQELFLGSYSSGAFAIGGDETPTWFYNFSASVSVSESTKLFGIFSEGVTKPKDSINSLVNSVSEIKSSSFAMGVLSSNNFTEDDAIGFAVSSPLHVLQGSAMINTPYGVDLSGNILRKNQYLNLTASAIETDIEAFYKIPADIGMLSFGAMRRINPDNIEDSEGEDIVMIKLVNRF